MKMKFKVILINLIFASCLIAPASSQVRSNIVLSMGGDETARKRIGFMLTDIINEVNTCYINAGRLENVEQYFDQSSFGKFKDLVVNYKFYSNYTEYRLRLLERPSGDYEVRGIDVRVNDNSVNDNLQELVFVINSGFKIISVRFGMELHHYKRLLDQGSKLDDMVFRQTILDFLENFRAAHNRKDINFIEDCYGNDALFIVGQLIQTQKGNNDTGYLRSLGGKRFRFLRKSKSEYITSLKRAFKSNEYIHVTFIDIEIVRHAKIPNIYGVTLKQRWSSSSYHDEGYLFLAFDYRRDINKPQIQVRAWQPEPFDDGTTINLRNFVFRDY